VLEGLGDDCDAWVVTTPLALLEDLRAVGTDVDDVWVLVNAGQRYPRAVPVLIDWLEHIDERGVPVDDLPRLREGLVRALSVRDARPDAVPVLLDELRSAAARGQAGLAWAAGNALGVVADNSCFDQIVTVAQDSSLGAARHMVVRDALGRMKNPGATLVLLGLLNDQAVDGHAVAALARRRDPRAREAFQRFVGDDRAWVRTAAKKGLQRLDG
jgi:HEAT repeat protein